MAIQLPRDLDARVQAAVRRFDIDPEYCRMALRRLDSESGPLFAQASIEYRKSSDLLAPADTPAVADAPARKPARRRSRRTLTDA